MASSGSESDTTFEVDTILKQRRRGGATEYLVRWKGYGEEEDSWEPAKNLRNCQDAIDLFTAASKTPVRSQRLSLSRKAKESEDVVSTKTTSVKQEFTKTTVQSNEGDSVSSSPEGSPVLGRRTMKQLVTTEYKTTQSTGSDQGKPVVTTTTKRTVVKSSYPPSHSQGLLKLKTQDIPIVVILSCILFIALTFVVSL